jgi:mRNA interferase MazF
MRRGDIWDVDLEPARGSEANKSTRPVVIVARDPQVRRTSTLGRGVITIVPLTTSTSRIAEFQTLLPADALTGLSKASKTQPEQIRSIDISRFISSRGFLSAEQLAALDDALRLHLDLEDF